jgi:hypothetical protein
MLLSPFDIVLASEVMLSLDVVVVFVVAAGFTIVVVGGFT